MTAKILDGKALATKIKQELLQKIEADDGTDMPVLAVVSVGDDNASQVYVRNKKKAAAEVGVGCEVLSFSDSIGENALCSSVRELNDNHHIHGIIVQLPLPKHLHPDVILQEINPIKDADGFTTQNIGALAKNEREAVVAATPKGILRLLENEKIELAGKHAVIIGRSNIVGRPLAMLLLNHHCTVTIAHSKTQNLSELTKQADILVAACGQAKMVKKEWIKAGAVVIDVGMNRDENGKLCGDVDFDDVKDVAGYITPVPGGVGPMTVAMLMENTWEAYLRQKEKGHKCSCGHEHCHCHHHHHHHH